MKKEVRPFIKWAGGKYKLADTIIDEAGELIDFDKAKTYIEPFVGGGGMLFAITNRFDFEKIIISDINTELMNTYMVVRDEVGMLIDFLDRIESEFNGRTTNEGKKEFYYLLRDIFNDNIKNESLNTEQAALFIALNKLGFNGLYRVNKKGLFNVPFGQKEKANLYEKENLINASHRLNGIEIYCMDYKEILKFVEKGTLIYFDSPYRPLSNTSSFTSYAKSDFNDEDQLELAQLVKNVNRLGGRFFLSNSDPTQVDVSDTFFDDIYGDFTIKRIDAKRLISAKSSGRGSVSEILVIG